jgi:hypothetical protein
VRVKRSDPLALCLGLTIIYLAIVRGKILLQIRTTVQLSNNLAGIQVHQYNTTNVYTDLTVRKLKYGQHDLRSVLATMAPYQA